MLTANPGDEESSSNTDDGQCQTWVCEGGSLHLNMTMSPVCRQKTQDFQMEVLILFFVLNLQTEHFLCRVGFQTWVLWIRCVVDVKFETGFFFLTESEWITHQSESGGLSQFSDSVVQRKRIFSTKDSLKVLKCRFKNERRLKLNKAVFFTVTIYKKQWNK